MANGTSSKAATKQGERDFSARTIKALAAQGVRVLGSVAVPDFEGDRYFSGVAYRLDDNGTGRVRSFLEVLALAKGGRS